VTGLDLGVIVTIVLGYVTGIVAVVKLQGDRINDLAHEVHDTTTAVREMSGVVGELRGEMRQVSERTTRLESR
jgi:hypothetical protein